MPPPTRDGKQRKTLPSRSASSHPFTDLTQVLPIGHRMSRNSARTIPASATLPSPTCPPFNHQDGKSCKRIHHNTDDPSPNRDGPNSWHGNIRRYRSARRSFTWTAFADHDRNRWKRSESWRIRFVNRNSVSHRIGIRNVGVHLKNSHASFVLGKTYKRMWMHRKHGYRSNLISIIIARCTKIITLGTIRRMSSTGKGQPRPFGIVIPWNWIRGVINHCGVTYWISIIFSPFRLGIRTHYFVNIGVGSAEMVIGIRRRMMRSKAVYTRMCTYV
mmetsp:Transcript_11260/g.32385  ORF Transcript_11260/g.32385 Transcript_11260/m.32385 type:complete len:273 (-) Transcript_11260:169-987(-)